MKNKTILLIVLISFGVFIVFGAFAAAGYSHTLKKYGPLDYTLDGDLFEYISREHVSLENIDVIHIETVSTDITLSGSSDGLDTTLSVDKFSSLKQLKVETEISGSTLYVSITYPPFFQTLSGRSQLVVALPDTFDGDIIISTASGDIEGDISNRLGSFDFNTVSGDTEVSFGSVHSADFLSTSGDIEITGEIIDSLSGETASGDITIRKISDSDAVLSIKSISGMIEMDYASACETQINSTSGDIFLDIPNEAPIFLTFSSTSGNVSGDVNLQSSGTAYNICTVSGDLTFD